MDSRFAEDARSIDAALRQRIAHSIRQIRVSRGITQEALALRSGLALRHLQKVEAAEVNVTIRSLARIAAGLKVDVSDLVHRDEVEESPCSTS